MKLFKFWTPEKVKITIDGQETEITCWGRSNVSAEEARVRAREDVLLLIAERLRSTVITLKSGL